MSAFSGYVAAALQYGLNAILVKPKRSFGPFEMQVVLEEVHSDDLEITDHPVEQGAIISDHAYKRPAEVRIMGGWSDSPVIPDVFRAVAAVPGATVEGVQSLIKGNNVGQGRDIYAKILKLQSERTPFDVYTGKRTYTDMLIKSVNMTTDKDTEHSLLLTVTLRQVIIVNTQLVTLAPAENQTLPETTAAPSNLGTKSLVPTNRYDAGGGRGFVNPATVTP